MVCRRASGWAGAHSTATRPAAQLAQLLEHGLRSSRRCCRAAWVDPVGRPAPPATPRAARGRRRRPPAPARRAGCWPTPRPRRSATRTRPPPPAWSASVTVTARMPRPGQPRRRGVGAREVVGDDHHVTRAGVGILRAPPPRAARAGSDPSHSGGRDAGPALERRDPVQPGEPRHDPEVGVVEVAEDHRAGAAGERGAPAARGRGHATSGAATEAAVIIATVPEPCASRTRVAIRNGTSTPGRPVLAIASASASPTPSRAAPGRARRRRR